MSGRHTLEGLVVDPVDGASPGAVVVEDGLVVEVSRRDDGPMEPLVFPGFVDLQVYAPDGVGAHGVTGYLQATRSLDVPLDDPLCLGLHLEGPFLNPAAAGAIPVEELKPVDLGAVEEWVASGRVRMVTLAPELPGALAAIERLAAAGIVPALGHTLANGLTVRAALDAGARFATHLWNAMAPVAARTTGPALPLLLDARATLGLVADGRHLHPQVEELTVRLAGPGRIALTSDLVPQPAHGPDGALLGGDRCGAALVARFAPRFGLAQAAAMASLVPARLLGLSDRGRLAPGHRADLAVLGAEFGPHATFVAGRELA